MQYTAPELTAIVKSALTIMAVDGVLSEPEYKRLFNELDSFNVTTEQFQIMLRLTKEMTNEYMVEILSGMDTHKKKYAMGFLAALMMSDAKIHPAELEIWNLLSDGISAPAMTPQEALNYWADN